LLPVHAPAPPTYTRVAAGQYPRLVKRLMDTGMAELIDDPIVVNGCFASPKTDGMQRFLVDARPMCAYFRKPRRIDLTTADRFGALCCTSHGARSRRQPVLEHAARDLSDYFYTFEGPPWLRRYSALKGIRAGRLGLSPQFLASRDWTCETTVYPALRILIMGWDHSPGCAQNAHEHAVYSLTSLRREDALTRFTDRRLDRLRHSIVMDDVYFVAPAGHGLVEKAESEYDCMAESQGWLIKHSKTVRCTSAPIDSLGLEVDAAQGSVSLSALKALKLLRATLIILQRGFASGRQMAQLTGCWSWPMLVNRPSLSAFRSVYRFAACAGDRTYWLWPSVVTELKCVIGLLPMLRSDLTSESWNTVLASDASELASGVVYTRCSSEDLFDLSRLASAQASATRAEARQSWDEAGDLVRPRIPSQPLEFKHLIKPPAFENFVIGSRWRTVVSSPWMQSEHITSLEARSALTALRWAVSSPAVADSRLFLFVDNMALFWALNKGRSSSPLLHARLRSIAYLLLCFGCRLTTAWINTEANPADAASRLAPDRSTTGYSPDLVLRHSQPWMFQPYPHITYPLPFFHRV